MRQEDKDSYDSYPRELTIYNIMFQITTLDTVIGAKIGAETVAKWAQNTDWGTLNLRYQNKMHVKI